MVHLSRQRRGASYIGIKLTSEPKNAYRMEHRFVFEGCETDGKPMSKHLDVHHIDGDTHNNNINNLELLNHSLHASLTRYGCPNDHQVKGLGGRFVSSPTSKFGAKIVKELPHELRAGLVNQFPKVISVVEADNTDVYDIHVVGTNNVIANYIVAHNCGEIILRNKQFCNLSEVVARSNDTGLRLLEKVRIATILGTYQATLVKFPYLSKEWKKNCEDERLLGVSITGQFDSKSARNPTTLEVMKDHAIKVNKEYSKKFGISPATAVTCVKPSGTVSQLVNASSGMHPRFAQFYIRRVRINASDPLFKMVKDQGIPYKPEVGQAIDTATTFVLEFPIKSPPNTKTVNGTTAIKQLEHWKMVATKYTEHNPSNTIYVGEGEWLDTAAWLWHNWDIVGGLSFLPKIDHIYELAPYEEITEKKYKELVKSLPKIDFTQLPRYELGDSTQSPNACEGATCPII